jgi:hypothetical protein
VGPARGAARIYRITWAAIEKEDRWPERSNMLFYWTLVIKIHTVRPISTVKRSHETLINHYFRNVKYRDVNLFLLASILLLEGAIIFTFVPHTHLS